MDENLENKPINPEAPEVKEGFNKTPLLVAALVILTGILLIVSLTARNGGKLPIPGQQQAVQGTNLSFGDQQSATVSGSAEVEVKIDSPKDKIYGTQLEISYDPAEITVTDIRPGTFFTNPQVIQKEIDSKNGLIIYSLTPQLGETGLSGSGVLAVITFSKLTEGESQISFNSGSVVTPEGSSNSILDKTTSGILTSTQ